MGSMEVPGERAAEHPQGVRRRRKRQSRQRRTQGGGLYRSVYRSISGSGKRRMGLSTTTKTPAKATPRAGDLRTRRKYLLRVPSSPVPRRALLLFLFWTVHGPFSLFLLEEKEKMGGAMNQPSLVSNPPRPKGEQHPPLCKSAIIAILSI